MANPELAEVLAVAARVEVACAERLRVASPGTDGDWQQIAALARCVGQLARVLEKELEVEA